MPARVANVERSFEVSAKGHGIARHGAAWLAIGRGLRPPNQTLAQWGRVGKITSVKRLYQPLTMIKGMCDTLTAAVTGYIALAKVAYANCVTRGIVCLQLDPVNRLNVRTIQPDQSFKKDSTERGCHLMQTCIR